MSLRSENAGLRGSIVSGSRMLGHACLSIGSGDVLFPFGGWYGPAYTRPCVSGVLSCQDFFQMSRFPISSHCSWIILWLPDRENQHGFPQSPTFVLFFGGGVTFKRIFIESAGIPGHIVTVCHREDAKRDPCPCGCVSSCPLCPVMSPWYISTL